MRAYVSNVRSALGQNLAKLQTGFASAEASNGFSLNTLLNVAVEHRLMHAETLAYILHQLPLDMKVPQPTPRSIAGAPVIHRSIAIPSGEITLGLARNSEAFGWDNEYEANTVEVPCIPKSIGTR